MWNHCHWQKRVLKSYVDVLETGFFKIEIYGIFPEKGGEGAVIDNLDLEKK